MPGDRTLRSLDASHVIPTRVLCFEVSGLRRCQSLITQGSDHPPVLEPHMVLNLPLDDCIDNTHTKVTREKGKRKETSKKNLQQAIESQTKAKSKIT
jgi:hypothetical protein